MILLCPTAPALLLQIPCAATTKGCPDGFSSYLIVRGIFLTRCDTQLHGLYTHLLWHVCVLQRANKKEELSRKIKARQKTTENSPYVAHAVTEPRLLARTQGSYST